METYRLALFIGAQDIFINHVVDLRVRLEEPELTGEEHQFGHNVLKLEGRD